jgi:hypothetical protein
MNQVRNIHQLTKFEYKSFFEQAVDFDSYLNKMQEEAALKSEEGLLAYVPMNLQRVTRILKTYEVSSSLLETIEQIQHKINWLVITENWCGDAAQIIPVIHKIAQSAGGKINLKLIYRDEHLPLIDAHLTGSSRSIPKLIQLDTHFNLTAIWGPRPNEAQQLVVELKNNPATADKYSEELHKWYAQNKQTYIERDLIKAIQKGSALCADCFI